MTNNKYYQQIKTYLLQKTGVYCCVDNIVDKMANYTINEDFFSLSAAFLLQKRKYLHFRHRFNRKEENIYVSDTVFNARKKIFAFPTLSLTQKRKYLRFPHRFKCREENIYAFDTVFNASKKTEIIPTESVSLFLDVLRQICRFNHG